MNKSKEDEIRAFCISWLMEFGDRVVVGDERHDSDWYAAFIDSTESTLTVIASDLAPYFNHDNATDSYQLNQDGLDFIKGE